jgi:type I restriction enzyme S subunit
VVIGRVGQRCGEVHLTSGPAWITDNALFPRRFLRNVHLPFLPLALLAAGLNDLKNRNDLPLITQTILHAVRVAVPRDEREQIAISEVLSDADALIDSLEQLLAKRRQIKQGAMQELLTGKRRLPGFSESWRSGSLGDMGSCLRGVSYDPDHDLSEGDAETTIRLLRSNNVQGSLVQFTDMQFVDEERVAPAQVLRLGDVLICMANGSRDLVGKAARICSADGHRYTFGAFMGCFRPDPMAADTLFAFYLFQTWAYRSQIGVLLAGSSINNLSPGAIEGLRVRVPVERTEQTAIATLLSDLDTELEALEARLTKARRLKQGMMQALLTGRIRLV